MALNGSAENRESDGRRRTVIVGFADALAAPESVWSLQDAGFEVSAFARAGTKPPLRRLRSVPIHWIRAPERDLAGAMEDLRRLLVAGRPDALLPLDDTALRLTAEAGGVGGAVLASPTGARLELALNKEAQIAAAADAGFRVPRTLVCRDAGDVLEAPWFPCVVKPALAVSVAGGRSVRGGARVCVDRGQVRAAAERLAPCGTLLVQELVPGKGEGLFGLARHGGIVAWSAHRRVRMMNPAGSGSSACVSVRPDPQVRACAERLLASVSWEGLFMVELIRDAEGALWFVELNGRPWGSMALARRSSLEYPAWSVLDALGCEHTVAPPVQVPGIRCRHLGRELAHMLFVLRGTDRPGPGWPSRAVTVRDVLSLRRGDRWYNWRRGHLDLFVDDAVRTVTGVIARRLS